MEKKELDRFAPTSDAIDGKDGKPGTRHSVYHWTSAPVRRYKSATTTKQQLKNASCTHTGNGDTNLALLRDMRKWRSPLLLEMTNPARLCALWPNAKPGNETFDVGKFACAFCGLLDEFNRIWSGDIPFSTTLRTCSACEPGAGYTINPTNTRIARVNMRKCVIRCICEARITLGGVRTHLNFCPYVPFACTTCNKFMNEAELRAHAAKCSADDMECSQIIHTLQSVNQHTCENLSALSGRHIRGVTYTFGKVQDLDDGKTEKVQTISVDADDATETDRPKKRKRNPKRREESDTDSASSVLGKPAGRFANVFDEFDTHLWDDCIDVETVAAQPFPENRVGVLKRLRFAKSEDPLDAFKSHMDDPMMSMLAADLM